MFLNEEFLNVYEELSELNEAKADTQRLIDFAGEDLANRFLIIKNRLKSPKNDIYYWIKHKTPEDLEATVSKVETTQSSTKAKKAIADDGAELVEENEYWKVYHITTFAASQKYGRDTKWCISGVGADSKQSWNLRNRINAEIYFFINKKFYDKRGTDSKFALLVYPAGTYDVFNQQDTNVETLDSIPHITGIKIPGINFTSLSPAYGDDGIGVCDLCQKEFLFDELCYNSYDELVCDRCYEETEDNEEDIDEHKEYVTCIKCKDILEKDNSSEYTYNIYGEVVCWNCFSDYLNTKKGLVDMFVLIIENGDGIKGNLGHKNIDKKLSNLINAWCNAKHKDLIKKYSDEQIAEYEKDFIEVAKEDGITLDPNIFD